MNKKHITHGKLKVFMILFLAVILIVLVVVCAKKIKLSKTKKILSAHGKTAIQKM